MKEGPTCISIIFSFFSPNEFKLPPDRRTHWAGAVIELLCIRPSCALEVIMIKVIKCPHCVKSAAAERRVSDVWSEWALCAALSSLLCHMTTAYVRACQTPGACVRACEREITSNGSNKSELHQKTKNTNNTERKAKKQHSNGTKRQWSRQYYCVLYLYAALFYIPPPCTFISIVLVTHKAWGWSRK